MADLDLIGEVRVEATSSGVSETLASIGELGRGIDGLVVTQDKQTKAQERVNRQLEATAKKYDLEYRAVQELTRVQALLERARSQGLQVTEAYSRVQDNVTVKLQAQAAAARVATEAQQRLAAAARAQAQASVNAVTGVRTDFSTDARAADIAAYAAELDRLRARFVPLFAIQQRYQQQQDEIAEALRVGAISANEAAAANLRLTRSYEDQTQKLERLAQSQKEAAQRQVNQQLIVPDRGSDIAAYAAELDRLQAKFDPLFRAEQAYIGIMEELERALSVGAISQDVFNKRAAEQGEILDRAVAKINGVAEAHERAAQAMKTAAAAQEEFNRLLNVRTDFNTEARAADIEAYGRALSDTRAKYDPLYRAQREYVGALKDLRSAYAAGAIDQETFTRNLDAQKAAFAQQVNQLGLYSRAQREAAAAAQEAARAAQDATNKLAAQQAVNAKMVVPDRAADIAAYGEQLDALRAKFSPVFAAEREYEQVLEEVNRALRVGAITEQERTAAVATARARLLDQTNEIRKAEEANARLTRGVGLNAYAWQNLGFQVNDVVTSLASGISPMQTLAQQGGQIFQILQSGQGGVAGALKAVGEAAIGMTASIGGAAAAVAIYAGLIAVAVYRFTDMQQALGRATQGVGKAAGATVEQLTEIANSSAATGKISVRAAADIETAFLKTGKVPLANFESGIEVARRYALVTGQELPAASQELAAALADLGGRGFDTLQERTLAFDARAQENIRTLRGQGDAAGATRVAIDALGRSLRDADQYTGFWKRTWDALGNSISTAITNRGQEIERLTNSIRGTSTDTERLQSLQAERESSNPLSRLVSGRSTEQVDREIAALQRRIAAQREAAAEEGRLAQQRRAATREDETRSIVPDATTYAEAKRANEELRKTYSALEFELDKLKKSSASSDEITAFQQRLDQAGLALKRNTAQIRDYEGNGGASGIIAARLQAQADARKMATDAVTASERAEAAAIAKKAEQLGSASSAEERLREQAVARKQVLDEAAAASRNQDRTTQESIKTQEQLADAYGNTRKSTALLSAERKAEEAIKAGTIQESEREAKTLLFLRESQAQLSAEQAKNTRSLSEGVAARQALNDKVAAGQMVSAEAERRLSAETELRRLSVERDAASGEAKVALAKRYDELKAAQEAQMSAEDRSRVQSLAEDEDRKIAALQKEADLLGLTTRQRQVALAVLQAEQDLRRQGISTTSAESTAYLDKVRLRADLDAAKSEYERLAQDISSVVSGIFDDMFKAGNKGLAGFADSFSRGFSRIGTRLIEQNLIAPLLSDPARAGGNILSGFGSLFDTKGIESAVKTGSETGIKSSFGDLLKPQGGGGFATSKLGAGLVAAGAGASIGYQSQSPVMGVLGGALSGLATGNPIMAAIGAGAGLLGGLLGASKAREERQKEIQNRLKELKDQYESQRTQIEQFRAGLRGEATGGVEGELRAAFAQMIQANKIASQGGDQASADQMVVEYKAYEARMRAGVRATMDGVEKEVLAGFGTNGTFAQAAASVRQLGETMRSWLNDVNMATGAFDGGALDAIYKGLLATLQPTPEMSSTAKEYQRIQGTAAALQQELTRLNGSAEGAAASIRNGVTKALDTLRASFNADLDAKINDVQGKGYLNDVVDLLKEVSGLRLDAGLIGGDLGKVDTYFAAAAQKIVNESQLTGEAFSALVTQYPALNGLVREYSAALADQASTLEQVAERTRAFQDRLFAATNDSTTLAGQLAAFDRAAAKERADEAKAGGQAMADLEQALSAERLNVIRTFAEQAAQAEKAIADRRLGFADRLFAAQNDTTTLAGQLAAFDRKAEQERQAEIAAGGQAIADLEAAQYAERLKLVTDYQQQAADAEQQRMEAAQQAFDTFARNIKTFVDGLRAGSASPLSPQARLAAAQSQYNAQLTLAQGGDRTALDGITSYASDLLDAAKGFYASSSAFQAIFQQVTGQLTALPSQVSPEQFIVNAIDASKTATVNATQAMQAALKTAIDAGSASATATALLPQFNTLTATTGGLLNYGQFLSATGNLATSSEQQAARAIFNSLDRNNDGQLSKLELINGQVLATAGNTGQTKGAVDTVATLTNNQTALFNEIIRWTAATNTSAANTKAAVDGINAVSEQQKALLGDVSRWTNATFSNTGATNASVQTSNNILAQLQQLNATNNNQNEVALASARENYATASNTQKLVVNTYNNNLKIGAAATLATGGWVNGPGTATSDSIPAFLSNGEFVVNAASARVYGPLLEAMNDNRFGMPAMPMPMPVMMGPSGSDTAALVARIDRLEVALTAALDRLARVTAAGAEHVRDGIDRTTDAVEDGQRTAAALAA